MKNLSHRYLGAGLFVCASAAPAFAGVPQVLGEGGVMDWISNFGVAAGPLVLAGMIWLVRVAISYFDIFEDATDLLQDLFDSGEAGDRRRRKVRGNWWARRKREKEAARLASVVVEPYAPAAEPDSQVIHRSTIPKTTTVRRRPVAPDPAPEPAPLLEAVADKPRLTALERARKGIGMGGSGIKRPDPFEKFAAQIEEQKARLNQAR